MHYATTQPPPPLFLPLGTCAGSDPSFRYAATPVQSEREGAAREVCSLHAVHSAQCRAVHPGIRTIDKDLIVFREFAGLVFGEDQHTIAGGQLANVYLKTAANTRDCTDTQRTKDKQDRKRSGTAAYRRLASVHALVWERLTRSGDFDGSDPFLDRIQRLQRDALVPSRPTVIARHFEPFAVGRAHGRLRFGRGGCRRRRHRRRSRFRCGRCHDRPT
jgi:hypothetical protein